MSKKIVFLVGMVLLAHALYMAFSLRPQLHAWHHGGVTDASGSVSADKAPAPAMLVPVAVEALAGFAVTILGFIFRSPLTEARLADFTKFSRYDEQIHTGVPFMTFNHRGAARNRGSQAGSVATDESRKNA